jgi:hypothetical protein
MVAQTPIHVGCSVGNLAAAMAELTSSQGLKWRRVNEITIGDWPIRLVYSTQGPPYVELVEGPPGSPWDSEHGAIHHLGYWSDDLRRDLGVLAQRGMTVELDGSVHGFGIAYLRPPYAGVRMELVDCAPRALKGFERALGFDPGSIESLPASGRP